MMRACWTGSFYVFPWLQKTNKKKINNKLLHLGIWQCAVVCVHNFDGPLLECFAALKVKRHDDDASWKTVFFPCSGQQMGAVYSILAILLYEESSRNPTIKHTTDGTFSIFRPALIKQPNNI